MLDIQRVVKPMIIGRKVVAPLLILAACGTPSTGDGPAEPQPAASSDLLTLPPAGYGTLRQDDFTITLASGPVQVKVTPLHEAVIRLAAPDTYQRLHGMATSRKARIDELAQRAGAQETPLVFLVSFFTYQVQERFEPSTLQILSRGILYRPVGILPLTPEWGREQLKQQQSESALYLFDPAIDLRIGVDVEYGGVRSFGWASIIRVLEAERSRVLSRAAS